MTAKRKIPRYFVLGLGAILSLFLFRVASQGYDLYCVHKETVKTQAKVDSLKKENAQLEQEKENLGDIRYIEKVARNEHNMVGKNEIPLFMIDGKDKAKASGK